MSPEDPLYDVVTKSLNSYGHLGDLTNNFMSIVPVRRSQSLSRPEPILVS